MPVVSKKQHGLFRAVLAGKARKKGISKKVAKEFIKETSNVKNLPIRVTKIDKEINKRRK